MTLAVMGKRGYMRWCAPMLVVPLKNAFLTFIVEELDELEEIVVPLFKTIENRRAKKYKYTAENHPWPRDQLGYKVYIVPYAEGSHTLYLTFPVPDVSDRYRTAVSRYPDCRLPASAFVHIQNMESSL